MTIKARYLKKTKHARLLGTDTIIVEGGNAELEESCKNNEIVGVQSFTPLKIYNRTPFGRPTRDSRATLPINRR